MLKKYYLVCDYREKFGKDIPNDHYGLNSLLQIRSSIEDLGYTCAYFGGVNELIQAIKTQDYDRNGIYLNFNDGIATKSKRGQTPMLLELMGVAYSGSSPLTHLAASDKYYTNCFLDGKFRNLIIPRFKLLKNKDDVEINDMAFPVILKPNDEGSSLGINEKSVCFNMLEARTQYDSIKTYGDIIVQQFIRGYELTNYFIRDRSGNILFNELLLVSKNGSAEMNEMIFTYDDKSNHKRKYYDPTSCIGRDVTAKIKRVTAKIASAVNVLSLGRADYRYLDGKLYFIELNTVPAFGKSSDVGEICNLYGFDFNDIVKLFLKSADQ